MIKYKTACKLQKYFLKKGYPSDKKSFSEKKYPSNKTGTCFENPEKEQSCQKFIIDFQSIAMAKKRKNDFSQETQFIF